MIVGVAGQRFAIPLNSVLETLSFGEGEIQHSDGRELLNLRGEALPLRRLAEEFALAPPEPAYGVDTDPGGSTGSPADSRRHSGTDALTDTLTDERGFVVVLGLGDRRTGLLVESLHGQQDTVIKPIQGPVVDIPGIAGATEQGERGAILVIDVASIVDPVASQKDAA